MNDSKRLIKSSIVILAGTYVILVTLMSVFQEKLVYFPSESMDVTPKNIGLEYESVTLSNSDNTEIFGWYIPSKDANTTLLYMHGNGGNISNRLSSIEIFNSLGLNIFIFDYRGYGNSSGSASEQNTYDDAMRAWEYLINEKGIKAENIIIFGRSLGGAIAANLASQVKPKAVILESTLTSAKDMASDVYPFVPSSLIRFKYETLEYLKDINSPILIIHSENDNIIPFKHGKIVFENANEPKTFVQIRGSHNHGFLESKVTYIKALENFLKEVER